MKFVDQSSYMMTLNYQDFEQHYTFNFKLKVGPIVFIKIKSERFARVRFLSSTISALHLHVGSDLGGNVPAGLFSFNAI